MADYSLLTDDELLRLTSDDREAFGEFYGRHVWAVLGELRRRGLATDEALDLTAEVFAAALVASLLQAVAVKAGATRTPAGILLAA